MSRMVAINSRDISAALKTAHHLVWGIVRHKSLVVAAHKVPDARPMRFVRGWMITWLRKEGEVRRRPEMIDRRAHARSEILRHGSQLTNCQFNLEVDIQQELTKPAAPFERALLV
jgi:hypothetical protein